MDQLLLVINGLSVPGRASAIRTGRKEIHLTPWVSDLQAGPQNAVKPGSTLGSWSSPTATGTPAQRSPLHSITLPAGQVVESLQNVT